MIAILFPHPHVHLWGSLSYLQTSPEAWGDLANSYPFVPIMPSGQSFWGHVGLAVLLPSGVRGRRKEGGEDVTWNKPPLWGEKDCLQPACLEGWSWGSVTSPWTALTYLLPDPEVLGPSWMFGSGALGERKRWTQGGWHWLRSLVGLLGLRAEAWNKTPLDCLSTQDCFVEPVPGIYLTFN